MWRKKYVLTLLLALFLTTSAQGNMVQCRGETEAVKHVVNVNGGGGTGVSSLSPADFDQDGDVDLAAAFFGSGKVAWFENVHGNGSEWVAHDVSSGGPLSVYSVWAVDLNNDSVPDIAAAIHGSNKITWHANTAGDGSVWTSVDVDTSVNSPTAVVAADIDGDLDLDLASASEGDDTIAWYENIDGLGISWAPHLVNNAAGGAFSLAASDVDGDGDTDLVGANFADHRIAWYNNTHGDGSEWEVLEVGIRTNARSVVAADLDGDGDVDFATASAGDDTIAWYENANGNGAVWLVSVVSTEADNAHGVTVADLDGDGDLDLASASFDDTKVAWYANVDGRGTFGSPQIVSTTAGMAIAVAAADLDGDGYNDLASASIATVDWYTGADVGATPWAEFSLDSAAGDVRSLATADFDGDGDVDIAAAVAAGPAAVVWYENTNGVGSFGAPRVVSPATSDTSSLAVADLDGDGDVDLATAAPSDNKIAWFENTDGGGTFGPERVVSTTVLKALVVVAADVDGDGNLDLAAVANHSPLDRSVVWFSNTDGRGAFGPKVDIDPFLDGASALVAADVDGDGDMDFAATRLASQCMVWYENVDGDGEMWTKTPLACLSANALTAVDLNGDGAVDIAAVQYEHLLVAINDNGDGSAWTRLDFSFMAVDMVSVVPVDFDGDGDTDLAIARDHNGVWVENVDGSATAWTLHDITSPGTPMGTVAVADIDGDGDVDLVAATAATGPITWHSSLTRGPLHRDLPATYLHSPRPSETNGSFAAIARSVSALSKCAHHTLLLPAGRYGCAHDSHLSLNFALRLRAEGNGDVLFDCQGGVLFRAVVRDGGVGNVDLVDVSVSGTGAAELSTVGAPGLRADGPGARLGLLNTTVEGGTSVASATVLSSGLGGCALAVNGGQVVGVGSMVRACSASSAGGGLAAVGQGSVVELVDSMVEGCTAGTSGGGLAALAGAVAVLDNVLVENNSALGVGGGVWVDARPDAGVSVVMGEGTTIQKNTAAVGGGLAVVPEGGAAAVVSATSAATLPSSTDGAGGSGLALALVLDGGVQIKNNTAERWGGGMYLCNARASVGPASGGLVMGGNKAGRSISVGSSADVLVCAAGPSFVHDREAGGASGVPWIDVDAGVWAGPGTGWAVNGPLARLEWVDEPLSHVEAGAAVQGSVKGVDWFGLDVAYDGVRIESVVEDDGESSVPALAPISLPLSVLSTRLTLLPPAVLRLVGLASAPAPVVLRASVVDAPSVGDVSAQVVIGPCGLGRGVVVENGVTACAVCADGTTSVTVSFDACILLRDCLPGSVPRNGSSSPDCECNTGFFFVGRETETELALVICDACPNGGVCARGLDLPVPAVGFFADGDASFIACKRPKACPGKTDRSCSEGYEGYMCNTCSEGWYSNSARNCVACPSSEVSTLVVGLVLLAVLVSVVAGVVGVGVTRVQGSGTRGRLGGGGETSVNVLRQRSMPTSISMVFVAAQVVGIVSDGRYSWSSGAKDTLGAFNVFNIDINLFGSECSLGSFHVKYAVSVLIPALVLLLVFSVLLVFKGAAAAGICGRRLVGVRVKTLFDAVLFFVAPLLYIPMARSTFVLFDCSKLPNGDLVVDVDPGIACLDSKWWSVAPVGLVGLAAYVLGVPLYFLWCLVRRRHELLTPATFAGYGSLYKLYRVAYWWGGVADLGKRLAIVVAAVFVSDHQLVQIGLLLAVFLSAAFAIKAYQPYYFPLYNALDFRLTLVLIVLLLLGGASNSERNTDGSSDTPILIGVLLTLAILAVVAVHAIATDVVQILRMRRSVGLTEYARRLRLAALLGKERDDMDHVLAAEIDDLVLRLVAFEEGVGKRGQSSDLELDDLDTDDDLDTFSS